ncbi:MAG: hypothetical protein PHU06_01275 [Gallionella sp.]|nr:hypothetical protein [Gallionella sp.]MDD4958184.1 hypothetical protein [Gallionella sp.]
MNINEHLMVTLQHGMAIKRELDFSYSWLSQEKIDAQWVEDLSHDEIKKERVSGFCARFARFQDYLADKVLRRWLAASGEKVNTAIENYAIAEKVGVLAMSSEEMIELRSVRNKLSHEYEADAEAFAFNLRKMILATEALAMTFENIVAHARTSLKIEM